MCSIVFFRGAGGYGAGVCWAGGLVVLTVGLWLGAVNVGFAIDEQRRRSKKKRKFAGLTPLSCDPVLLAPFFLF